MAKSHDRAGESALVRWFAGLSTALKMLLILGSALFPLGLVAMLASLDAARDGRAERAASARVQAKDSAAAIASLVARDTLALRIVAGSIAGDPRRTDGCDLLRRSRSPNAGVLLSRFALFAPGGRRVCGDPSLRSDGSGRPPRKEAVVLTLIPEAGALRFTVAMDGAWAIAELDREALRTVAVAPLADRNTDLWLEQGGRILGLMNGYERGPLQRTIGSRAALAGSDVTAVSTVGAIPISATEIATILLPLLMWLAAALFGWLIVDRLLLRPIVSMQKAVLAYRPGGPPMLPPRTRTPATEIRDLGQAFAQVTTTVAAHEAELEAAIGRQGRLVREVHHRVKNNLQVVASLLNLHARGARSPDAAAAYATIQRRVDALSVVHRNHFAELEDSRGVALRPLLSELTGNLRATAPEDAAGLAITLDLDAAYVNQDVAVSVAFFVTEVVEHAMLCTPGEEVGVTLRRTDVPLVARLSLKSPSLRTDADCPQVDVRQFERITTGLSRQLRAVLDRDGEAGSFAIDIAIQPDNASSGSS